MSAGSSTASVASGEAKQHRVRLNRLTSLRFFAALIVVLHHTFRDLVTVPGLTPALIIGTVGVSFFFVLSGFVLTWSARPSDSPRAFYRRRFARVYPLHLLTFLIALPLLGWIGQGYTPFEVTANLLLVQAWVPSPDVYFGMNSPSWSLACEFFFYTAFPIIAAVLLGRANRTLWRALLSVIVVGLVVAIGVTVVFSDETARFLLYIFPPFRMLEFTAGCILARLVMQGVRCRIPLAVGVAGAALACVGLLGFHYGVMPVGHGVEDAVLLPFVLLIIAIAATSDIEGKASVLTTPWAVRLGEWSFALYITHWLLLQALVHADPFSHNRSLLARIAEGGLFVLVAIAVSGLAHVWVERPLERRLRAPRQGTSVSSGRS
jgi:peptidoglycan/LPS O-acetylase OafA/YrhL